MNALAAAPPWGRLIVSVCTCAHQTLSATQTVTRRFFFLDLCDSCLVPPPQGALGGFTYSCHVYTLAKQDLRTLQGGTEEEREVRPTAQSCGPVVNVADLVAVDAGKAAKAQSLTHRR